MTNVFQSLLLVIAGATQRELARQVMEALVPGSAVFATTTNGVTQTSEISSKPSGS